MSNIPAISTIIPMYNSERYIAECLESILSQTFNDYEVIVVDDCSMDNSVEVVKSYTTKFPENKLKLISLKRNSGTPGRPDNIGLTFSRGKYIHFLDSDDAITPDAYEKMYEIAESFNADVVACDQFYQINTTEKLTIENGVLLPYEYRKRDLVLKPTLIDNDPEVKVSGLKNMNDLWNLWSKLIRRSLVVKHNLRMTNSFNHDLVYMCCLICVAQRFVRIPDKINLYRMNEDSFSHKKEDMSKIVGKHIRSLVNGFNYADQFLSKYDLFKQRLDLKYDVLQVIAYDSINKIQSLYSDQQFDPYDIFSNELREERNTAALAAFLLDNLSILRVINYRQEKIIEQLTNRSEKRSTKSFLSDL